MQSEKGGRGGTQTYKQLASQISEMLKAASKEKEGSVKCSFHLDGAAPVSADCK